MLSHWQSSPGRTLKYIFLGFWWLPVLSSSWGLFPCGFGDKAVSLSPSLYPWFLQRVLSGSLLCSLIPGFTFWELVSWTLVIAPMTIWFNGHDYSFSPHQVLKQLRKTKSNGCITMKFMKGNSGSCPMYPPRVFYFMSFFLPNGCLHSATGQLTCQL